MTTRVAPETDPGRLRPALTRRNRREIRAMNGQLLALRAAQQDRVARYLAEAEAARLVGKRSSERRIRRVVGRSIVRLGERLAAEPAERLTPARSR